MSTELQLFGLRHIAIIFAFPILAAILALIQRRLSPGSRGLRFGLALILFVNGALFYVYHAYLGHSLFPNYLPLELCDMSLFLIIFVLLIPNRAIFDLTYYYVMAGASMSLLTPNLSQPLLSVITVQYFVNHGLMVTAVLFLVWSRQARPRPGSVVRAIVALNIYAVFIGIFNVIFKTNYLYLFAKPHSDTLLTVLGPWPWYIVSCDGVALILFLLLYLPFRKSSTDASLLD